MNGKMYIGQTNDFKKRKKDHFANGKNNKINTSLYNAMRKYGVDNFEMEIIEDDIKKEDINKKEIYYIKKYNTYYEGYNMTFGGDNCFQNSPVLKKKISKSVSEAWKNGVYENRKTNIYPALKKAHKNASKRMKEKWKDETFKENVSKKISKRLSKNVLCQNENEEILFNSYNEAISFLISKGFKNASKSAITRSKKEGIKAYGYYWKGQETIRKE